MRVHQLRRFIIYSNKLEEYYTPYDDDSNFTDLAGDARQFKEEEFAQEIADVFPPDLNMKIIEIEIEIVELDANANDK